jgi:hypothetical protein
MCYDSIHDRIEDFHDIDPTTLQRKHLERLALCGSKETDFVY